MRHRRLSTLVGSAKLEVPLELSDPSEHRHHATRGRYRPKAHKAIVSCLLFPDVLSDVQGFSMGVRSGGPRGGIGRASNEGVFSQKFYGMSASRPWLM